MKVTEIEVHPITLEYVDWIAYQLTHFYGPITRTVYVVHTDNGLIGLGESGSPESQEVIDGYIGTNPFDWVGDEVSLGLGTAMYDLMGQYAGVPVYKLFGQKYRSWVAGRKLDGVHASPSHGGDGGAVCRTGIHMAEVSSLTL